MRDKIGTLTRSGGIALALFGLVTLGLATGVFALGGDGPSRIASLGATGPSGPTGVSGGGGIVLDEDGRISAPTGSSGAIVPSGSLEPIAPPKPSGASASSDDDDRRHRGDDRDDRDDDCDDSVRHGGRDDDCKADSARLAWRGCDDDNSGPGSRHGDDDCDDHDDHDDDDDDD